MKIYVASSWRNHHQQRVVALLRELGHEVYDFRNPAPGNTGFSWSSIDPDWSHWTPEQFKMALSHPLAIEAFSNDFNGMNWADCCVMVLPCGRSANTEAGYMKGCGKPVYVYQPEVFEAELMYKIYDKIFTNKDRLIEYFGSAALLRKEVRNNNYCKVFKLTVDKVQYQVLALIALTEHPFIEVTTRIGEEEMVNRFGAPAGTNIATALENYTEKDARIFLERMIHAHSQTN